MNEWIIICIALTLANCLYGLATNKGREWPIMISFFQIVAIVIVYFMKPWLG